MVLLSYVETWIVRDIFLTEPFLKFLFVITSFELIFFLPVGPLTVLFMPEYRTRYPQS